MEKSDFLLITVLFNGKFQISENMIKINYLNQNNAYFSEYTPILFIFW